MKVAKNYKTTKTKQKQSTDLFFDQTKQSTDLFFDQTKAKHWFILWPN